MTKIWLKPEIAHFVWSKFLRKAGRIYLFVSYLLVLDNQNLQFHSYFPLQEYLRGIRISTRHLKRVKFWNLPFSFKNTDKGRGG